MGRRGVRACTRSPGTGIHAPPVGRCGRGALRREPATEGQRGVDSDHADDRLSRIGSRSTTTVPMFIELAEHLRCPEGHEERAYCVLVPDEMAGREVVRGSIACPVCEHVYPLRDGIADFSGTAPATATPIEASSSPGSPIAPDVAQALLGVAGPGGYVVLLGSAGRVATELAGLMEGIHFIGVNAPPVAVDEEGGLGPRASGT